MSYRWAIISNTTVSPLIAQLRKAVGTKQPCEFHVAQYGEADQQVLTPASALYSFAPNLIVVLLDLQQIKPGLETSFAFETPDARSAICRELVALTVGYVKALRANSTATLLINNFPVPHRTALGIGLDPLWKNALRDINLQIAGAVREIPQCYLYDLDSLWTEAGIADRDRRFEMLAQFPYGPKMQQLLIAEWLRYFRTLQGLSRKCIVVDLDNTLWGGILGEDGPDKLHLGDTPEGRPFRQLQTALKALQRRGVLLAIASKNNSADALAVLDNHPDMILRLADFSALQINWQDKATNLRAILTELNIGPQHLVFLDDTPAERKWVRDSLPEVLVPELPQDTARYADVLTECELDTLSLTEEDLKRTQMYHEDRERRVAQVAAPSYEDFLKQLELQVEIVSLPASHVERAAQLCQRTNQFNLTTRRHTAEQLTRFVESPDSEVFLMKVADRFGDYGWTGLAIAQINDQTATIDSFLVSCRVLGKHVEFALFWAITEWARSRDCRHLAGTFLPTAKNSLCADFYTKCGLKPVGESAFAAPVADLPPPSIQHIKLTVSAKGDPLPHG